MRTPILGLVVGLSAVACGGDDTDGSMDTGTGSSGTEVEVEFAALMDGQPLRCGDSYTLGSETFEYRGLRFYVTDVSFGSVRGQQPVELEDDGRWQDGTVALLDFEDGDSACEVGTADTRAIIRGQIADDAALSGLSFTLGVPFDANHQDVAQATGPLSLTSMFWNWQGGYKFMRLDGFADGGAYNIHLGSTGCDGGPMGGVTTCANPNRVDVQLDGYSPGDVVLLDLADLLRDAPLTNTEMTAPGCMSSPSDPECEAIFGNFGLAFGGAAAGAQSIFSVMAP